MRPQLLDDGFGFLHAVSDETRSATVRYLSPLTVARVEQRSRVQDGSGLMSPAYLADPHFSEHLGKVPAELVDQQNLNSHLVSNFFMRQRNPNIHQFVSFFMNTVGGKQIADWALMGHKEEAVNDPVIAVCTFGPERANVRSVGTNTEALIVGGVMCSELVSIHEPDELNHVMDLLTDQADLDNLMTSPC